MSSPLPLVQRQRIFLVTGANRGIGFELVKKLAKNHPRDVILLACRDQRRGEDALVRLAAPDNVQVLLLDVCSKESIQRARQHIEEKYNGHLDVLINNAAVGSTELTAEALRETLKTNLYGVKNMNDAMSPLLRDDGRIVNVSSGLGAMALKHCSDEVKNKLLDPNLTETQLEEIFSGLVRAVENGEATSTAGFHSFELPGRKDLNLLYYSASKLGEIVLTRLQARDWAEKKYGANNVLISAVCPGFCATDLNRGAAGARPAELGADSILHAVYTEHLANGQLWRDGSRLPFERD